MECLSVMYAIVTTKTKADIYHLRLGRVGGGSSWDLQGPAYSPICLEFLEIHRLWMAQEICDNTWEEAEEE